MEPTKEQIQWFWEQCGCKFTPHLSSRRKSYERTELMEYPNGSSHLVYKGESLEIDLNNLFKYAVPKLFTWSLGKNWELCSDTEIRPNGIKATAQSLGFSNPEFRGEAIDDDPALALFWAIYKTLEGVKC